MTDPEEYLDIKLRGDNLQKYVELMKSWIPETEIHTRNDGGVIIPSPETLSNVYRSGAGEIGHDIRGNGDYDTGMIALFGTRLEVTGGVYFLTIRKDYKDLKSKSLSRMTGVTRGKTSYWAIMGANDSSHNAVLSTEGLLNDEMSSSISPREMKLINMIMPDFLHHFEGFMDMYRRSLARAVAKGILNQNVADSVSVMREILYRGDV